jgi:pilus assembly protein Flp/PilA
MNLMNGVCELVRDEAGQDLLEYALLAGLIALVAISAIEITGGGVTALFERVPEKLAEVGL